MAQRKRGPRRTMPAGEPVLINKQVITPDELDDGGKLSPARGLPGGSGILPEEERDNPEVVLTELGLTVRKQIRADADKLFFFARLPKALGEKLSKLSKEIAADTGVEPEEADHVTVLYLRSSKGEIDKDLASDAARAAQKALEGMSPLQATLQGWGYFDGARKDGKEHTALVALLDCPGLAEAHVALKEAMEGLGLPVEAQTHGYVPHATVAYLGAGDRVDNLPTLGDKLGIGELELMHTKSYVLKLGGAAGNTKIKALTLAPDMDVSGTDDKDLLQVHWQLHLLFRDEKALAAAKFSTEDVTNLHALVVDELFGRGRKHPAPPDEGLDDVSADFERHVEEQPDWTEVPEKRVAEQELAPINSSGVERGGEITLGKVLPYFKSFKTKKPYVYLVGGLANRGATKGDIDILVRDTEDLPEDFKHVLHFRLGRMLPPELAERLEIHYDNFHGPFTKFVELYDLTFERINPANEVKLMRAEEDLGQHAYVEFEATFEALDDLELVMGALRSGAERMDTKVLGESSYKFQPQGVTGLLLLEASHLAIHTWPEKGRAQLDVLSCNLEVPIKPAVELIVQALGGKEALYKKEEPELPYRPPFVTYGVLPRFRASLLPRFPKAEYKRYVELFCGNGEMIWCHPKRAQEEVMNDIDPTIVRLHRTIQRLTDKDLEVLKGKDWKGRRTTFDRMRKQGAPRRDLDFLYREAYLRRFSRINEPHKSRQYLFRSSDEGKEYSTAIHRLALCAERQREVKVTSLDYKKCIEKFDGPDTFFFIDPPYPDSDGFYEFSCPAMAEQTEAYRKIKGKFLMVLKAPAKHLVEMRNAGFHEYRFKWPLQRFDIMGDKAGAYGQGVIFTNYDAAKEGIGNEILQKIEGCETIEVTCQPTRPVEKQADPYMEIPPEEKAPYRYTVQNHFRGESVHSDFRVAFRPGKLLIGWTLLTGIKDAVKTPVVTLAQARALGRTRMGEISKINWGTGEWAERPKPGAKEPVRVSVQATRKAPEPHAWLDVEGKTTDPVGGKPPPVGGTRNFPGVFQIVDSGDIEFGAQKPWLHEYFPSGRALNYRLFFRQLKLKEDGTVEGLPDNLKGEVLEKVVLPPSEEAELLGPIWLCIRPDDQTPYVLDKDAVDKGWMPPLGVSALPKAIREQVPAEHRYWEQRTAAGAKQARDALHTAIKAKEVELDFEAPYKRKTEKASMLEARFVLQEQTWRGPVQIRVGPSKTLWYLRLDVGRPELIVVEMYLDPLDNNELAARVIDDPHKGSMRFEGEIKPSHYLNPTKETPSRIEILDSGEASVLAASDEFLKVEVKGKRFKGLFEAKRSDGDWLWTPSRAAPEAKSEEDGGGEEWQVTYEVPILKVDEAKREITGIVLEPEERDAQNEIIDEDVIAKAAHRFLARFNRETEMGLMHKMFGEIGVELYESWTSKVNMELGGEKIKKGSWLMCVHVLNDSVWKKVQNGEIAGFSIGGTAAIV